MILWNNNKGICFFIAFHFGGWSVGSLCHIVHSLVELVILNTDMIFLSAYDVF
jgi:hypothetical protein